VQNYVVVNMHVWHTVAKYMNCAASFSSSNRKSCFIY